MKFAKLKLSENSLKISNYNQLFSLIDELSNVNLESIDLSSENLKNFDLNDAKLTKINFSSAHIDKFYLKNCALFECSMVASSLSGASWNDVEIHKTRATGVQLQDGIYKNIVFNDCALDLANFRMCRFNNVIFRDCLIDDMDFYGSELKNVEFINCSLRKINFTSTKIKNVGLSESTIESLDGIGSLKGIKISQEQLYSLAPYFANELGLIIKE